MNRRTIPLEMNRRTTHLEMNRIRSVALARHATAGTYVEANLRSTGICSIIFSTIAEDDPEAAAVDNGCDLADALFLFLLLLPPFFL